MREDGSDTRADVRAFDQGDVTDLHPCDVGNGVEPTGGQDAERDPSEARARVRLGDGRTAHEEQEGEESGAGMHACIIAAGPCDDKPLRHGGWPCTVRPFGCLSLGGMCVQSRGRCIMKVSDGRRGGVR